MTDPAETVRSEAIRRLHAEWCFRWHDAPESEATSGTEAFLDLVRENHWRNFQLWHEEDQARRTDIGAEGVRRAKRAIDGFNQERNNFIERLDQWLEEALTPTADGPFNSETPGMIIDRLSILSLKEYHMAEETERTDAPVGHREKCARRLKVIRRQLEHLATCLDELLGDIRNRRRSFRTYYQFKMYNDPDLNPELYRRKGESDGS